MTFNSDVGANYGWAESTNTVNQASTGQTSAQLINISANVDFQLFCKVNNISANKKLCLGSIGSSAPDNGVFNITWSNIVSQITSVQITVGTGTGKFAIGAELIILGRN